jgi:ribosome-associated protein
MRISDIDEIQITLDKMDHQSLTYRQHFKQLEVWRERIITQGNKGIESFLKDYPRAERQQLRNLQRQANREIELKKPPVASRKIFEYIRSVSE